MMTIEEKAKAYDRAVEQAEKEILACGSLNCDAARQIFRLFPDLKESEDERIRKTLIEELSACNTIGELKFSLPAPTREECIAWLERQKEPSMSAVTVLTKAGLKPYKDGNQWCILVGDNIQEGICGFGDTIDEALYHFLIEVLEKQKEQKPRIEIRPHSIRSKSYRENGIPTEPISDELVEIIKGEFEGFRNLLKKNGIDYEPQRGYWEGFARLFDSSAREYVKEQNPAWSEFDEGVLKDAIYATDLLGNDEKYKESNPNLAKAFRVAKDWLKSLPERFNLQPKQEWSEDDERMLHIILTDINYAQKNYSSSRLTPYDKKVSWLKALSLNLKKKNEDVARLCSNEWNEEDEAIVKFYEDDYNHRIGSMPMKDVIKMRLKFKDWVTNRIKYLRPSWKPSRLEKAALRTAIYILTEERSFPKAAKQLQNILNAFEDKEPRKDWKPSEEQVQAITYLASSIPPNFLKEQENIMRLVDEVISNLKKLQI